MLGTGSTRFKVGAFAAICMVVSSTAHAAPSSFRSVDPLVALSVFGTQSSRAAVCAAGTQAAASAAAAGAAAAAMQAPPGPGCVLPVLDAVPPPVVQTVVPVAPVATGFNFGSLLPLLAIAALGGIAILLLESDKDEGPPPLSPV